MTQQELNGLFDNLFKASYGKTVEVVDPNAYGQCVDWVIAWTDYINIPRVFPFYNAYQIYTDFGPDQAKYFDRYENTPSFGPIKGDLVVWGTGVGPNGHVAVATGNGDMNWFESSDQNWNGVQTIQAVKHNYSAVLGVLRPKIISSDNSMQDNIVRKSSFFDKRWLAEYPGVNTDNVTEQDLSNQIYLDQTRKAGNGKWDQICKLVGLDSKSTPQEVYAKLNKGCTKEEIIEQVNVALKKSL